nr:MULTISPECIES: type VI secretion system tube protein Hcp [Mycolicibacterium]
MPTEIFAKIGDIKGESTDARHPDEIDVVSFSWGVAHTGSTGSGAGGGAGKPTFQDLLIVHTIDSATPALLLPAPPVDTCRRRRSVTARRARTNRTT